MKNIALRFPTGEILYGCLLRETSEHWLIAGEKFVVAWMYEGWDDYDLFQATSENSVVLQCEKSTMTEVEYPDGQKYTDGDVVYDFSCDCPDDCYYWYDAQRVDNMSLALHCAPYRGLILATDSDLNGEIALWE